MRHRFFWPPPSAERSFTSKPHLRSIEDPKGVADTEKKPARGDVVTELGASVPYVLQAKNGDSWFGSNDRGVYVFDGKAFEKFRP